MAHKLKKKLGLLEVFCISSGAMISSGLFILPAIAYAKTGASVMIAYAIASLLILPTLLSKAELTTAMPKTGGLYFFTDRSMGPIMGTLGGLGAWFSLAFKTAFALLGIGIFVFLLNPGFTMFQIKLIAIACCLIFTAINIFGVKLSGKSQAIMVITLISLLTLYVVFGFQYIQFSQYDAITKIDIGSLFAVVGLIFISFAGTTKIAAVAGEVKNPKRNLPLGMFLSWSIVSLLYILVIFVTVGIVEPIQMQNSLTPLSLGGEVIMGELGLVVMCVAAFLAFISTGNAGILAASRAPMAMGKDELLPRAFGKVSKHGTPWVSILFTSGFMILIILFLDLENFVKAASTMALILFILPNLAVIFMRESKIKHYHPTHNAPFYPWAQIIGILAYGFLLSQMGTISLAIVGVFLIFGLCWYFIYAHGKIEREYALLHVVERIKGVKSRSYMMEEELREILIERDNVTQKRFEYLIEKCPIIDIDSPLSADDFYKITADVLAERLEISQEKLFKLLLKRGRDPKIVIHSGVACLSLTIKGHDKFGIVLVRDKGGITFSEKSSPVHAAFIIVSTEDERHFHLHSIMWIAKIAEETDFTRKWLKAKDKEELRKIILSSWKDGIVRL